MGKQKPKRPTPPHSKKRKSATSKRWARPTARTAKSSPARQQLAVTQQQRSGKEQPGRASKQAEVIAMLQAPHGASIQAIADATGWQPHSVRGFLAGVVRKKLGLDLQSSAADGGRVYRIADRPDGDVDATATDASSA